MKLVQKFVTQNPCYKAGKKITVKGLMLHSVGCPQPDAMVFVNAFNKSSYDRACVHAFIDANDGTVYQTLPWNHRAWHGGGSSNDTHIGVEMCEPNCIKYTTGANFNCSDKVKAQAMVKRTYEAAVELFAYLCKEYKLDPLKDIISHKEGGKKGVASAHVDPEHLWSGLGMSYTMDTFRKAVKAAMGETCTEPCTETRTDAIFRVQVGAFRKYEYADSMRSKITFAGYDAFVVHVGDLYKVQCGAFKNRSYAENLMTKLKALGYDAFITGGTTKKTVDELAKEVIKGYWGSGQDRKDRLTAAGYDYEAVQKRVNELL